MERNQTPTSRGSGWWPQIGAGVVAASLVALGLPAAAGADDSGRNCVAGAPGVGDPYFPTHGNGGYDVSNYDIAARYDPASDVLVGDTKIRARAEMRLCSFNLDLHGLDVHSVAVDGRGPPGPVQVTS